MKQETKGGGGGGVDGERQTLDAEEQIEQVKADLAMIADRGVPALKAAIERTAGTEGAKITITIGYKAGGDRSSSRLEVDGKVVVPLGGTSREVAIVRVDDENQLTMFAPDE